MQKPLAVFAAPLLIGAAVASWVDGYLWSDPQLSRPRYTFGERAFFFILTTIVNAGPVALLGQFALRHRRQSLSVGELLWLIEFIAWNSLFVLVLMSRIYASDGPTPVSTAAGAPVQSPRISHSTGSPGLALLFTLVLIQGFLFVAACYALLGRLTAGRYSIPCFFTDYLGILCCGASSAWFVVNVLICHAPTI
jgi:hypothetical protein